MEEKPNKGFLYWFTNVFWYHYGKIALIVVVLVIIAVWLTVDALHKETYDLNIVVAANGPVADTDAEALHTALMKKIEVNGPDAHPIYKYLKSQKGFQGFGKGVKAKMMEVFLKKIDPDFKNNSEIKWNFTKFLISRDGSRIERFAPTIPMDKVEKTIEEML